MIVVPWVLLMVGVATAVILYMYKKGTYAIACAYVKTAIRGLRPVIAVPKVPVPSAHHNTTSLNLYSLNITDFLKQ